MIQKSITLTPRQWTILARVANKKGYSTSELIRQILEEWMEKQ